MDQTIRNKLRAVVTQCRKLLEDAISQELEGKYAIFAKKDQVTADPNAAAPHLNDEEQAARKDILDHFGHIKARGFKPKDALDQLIREIAFTHLNRLCAYKMMEAREVYVGGQKFREAVSRGVNSNGVKFYLAEHPEDERLFNSGHQDLAYRHFLDWLGALLSDEIGVLFNPNDPANRLHPRQKTLDEVLDLLNNGGIKPDEAELREAWPAIWSQDETIGWVYQYFTPKELRDKARKESQAPRNSYELAFRNQFFTPRYVVEFLTDNTLGRIWYEMRQGETRLKDQCRYLVRRPTEMFLNEGEQPPNDAAEGRDDLSQEDLLQLPVHIPHRPKKDPRALKILDPACGSGHFLLYCFDLLLTIYEEAYSDPDLGHALQRDYPTLDDLRRDVPRLILAHNLHGIDIDGRASQIAALALWLRCQRAYQDMGLKKDRPRITRSNVVCAEPMPGEAGMLKEFVDQVEPRVLGQVVEVVFDKMKLAGEAGSLLKIEEEIRDAVAAAKTQWDRETAPATDRRGQPLLFAQAELDRLDGGPVQGSLFDLSDITDTQFFEQAESKVIDALRRYAEGAQNGQRLQRRLFAEDAVRGFAFVDLCQKRYDVVLMNPPFGYGSFPAKVYIDFAYPSTKYDLLGAFLERFMSKLHNNGLIGVIGTRTIFFIAYFSQWRERIFSHHGLSLFADLGLGVLDAALVETAAFALTHQKLVEPSICLRLLSDTNKQLGLNESINKYNQTGSHRKVFSVNTKAFLNIQESPLAYWVQTSYLTHFHRHPSVSEHVGSVKVGLQTGDDFRFIRAMWEVPISTIGVGKYWVPLAKGGEYRPFYDDIHLAVNWNNHGNEIVLFTDSEGKQRSRPQNIRYYFRSGITYPMRTTSNFSPRVLPENCIFNVQGNSVFLQTQDTPLRKLAVLAVFSTSAFESFTRLKARVGDMASAGGAGFAYTPGLIQSMPFPMYGSDKECILAELAKRCVENEQHKDIRDETTRVFVSAITVEKLHGTFALSYENHLREEESRELETLVCRHKIELLTREAYGFSSEDNREVDSQFGRYLCDGNQISNCARTELIRRLYIDGAGASVQTDIDEDPSQIRRLSTTRHLTIGEMASLSGLHPSTIVDIRREKGWIRKSELSNFVASVIQYAIGCCYGRWDILLATGEKKTPELPDPFKPIPVFSPGMHQENSDLLFTRTSKVYPLRIEDDGIIIDDKDHKNDIVHRVRQILELIWEDRTDTIEAEACKIFDVKDLRDYFRKPGKGGFWDDHISRYSKSRRKAPIYWLLQSSKKNYAIWIYYHRLDKDILSKALVNYVEPKIRLETSRLQTLRDQLTSSDVSSKETKRLAKDMERQEDFLSELRDFEDKLRRAANLHLEPDLNDGVVLNIAPLHELVPWKEAKKYWDELLAGKYEWSAIGKQLREKGLVH